MAPRQEIIISDSTGGFQIFTFRAIATGKLKEGITYRCPLRQKSVEKKVILNLLF